MIGDGKLLTNAHRVEYITQVKVKRRGDDTKYIVKVLARGVECDLALLFAESKEFWEGTEPQNFRRLPTYRKKVASPPKAVATTWRRDSLKAEDTAADGDRDGGKHPREGNISF